MMDIPIYGTSIEVAGVLCSFLAADISDAGMTIYTVRTTAGNAVRINSLVPLMVQLSPTIIQVDGAHCVAKSSIRMADGTAGASRTAGIISFQQALAKRSRYLA